MRIYKFPATPGNKFTTPGRAASIPDACPPINLNFRAEPLYVKCGLPSKKPGFSTIPGRQDDKTDREGEALGIRNYSGTQTGMS